MRKFAKIDSALLQKAVAAIEACWEAGSPVAGASPERWEEIARTAIRRIRSFDRRGISDCDRIAQVKDVARQLVEQFEAKPDLAGPLVIDYERLAGRVLEAIDAAAE